MKRTKRNSETADQAYQRQQARVQKLVADLKTFLENHANRQKAEPRNWGFAGDMNHYAEIIEEILGTRKIYTTADGIRVTVPEDGQ